MFHFLLLGSKTSTSTKQRIRAIEWSLDAIDNDTAEGALYALVALTRVANKVVSLPTIASGPPRRTSVRLARDPQPAMAFRASVLHCNWTCRR